MHEMSICQSIIKTVETEMKDSLEKIQEVHMEIGMLSCVHAPTLEHVYGFISAEGALKNSRLVTKMVAILAECEACRKQFQVINYKFICPDCNKPTSTILKGRELKIVKIILEDITHEEINK